MTRTSRREALLFAAAARMAIAQHRHSNGVENGRRLRFFSAEEAAEVEALAALIIPADETPGAKEAGVIYAIDLFLTSFAQDEQRLYREGLAEIRERVGQFHAGATRVAELDPSQQKQLMNAISGSEFFVLLRKHALGGFLCAENWGGNRSRVGWQLIGFEDHFAYQPPFGYYDAEDHHAEENEL